jgi:hypothetical protein
VVDCGDGTRWMSLCWKESERMYLKRLGEKIAKYGEE